MFDITEPLFWFSLFFILLIIEFMGAGALFAVIFAIGALITAGAAFATENIYILGTVFIISSLISLILLKPLLEKWFNTHKSTQESNVNAINGQKGIVSETITETAKGMVELNNEQWTATSTNGKEIKKGTPVIAEKVEGVTLHVRVFEEKVVD